MEREIGPVGLRTSRMVVPLVGVLTIIASCATVDPSIVRQPLTNPAGAITGQVLSFGAPVPGVAINTQPPTGGGVTDTAGRFTLTAIQPQTLTVVAQTVGFLAASVQVTVLPGQTATATLSMVPASGSAIFGRVTDGVMALPQVLLTTVPPTAAVTSAPDGSYLFVGLEAGRYRVDATKDGFWGATTFVALGQGEGQRVDLALTRRGDGVIVGTVTDGVNPVGARERLVKITRFEGGSRREFKLRPEHVEPTGPMGPQFPLPLVYEYFFDGLSAGPNVVQAECPGYVPGIKEIKVEPPLVGNGDIVLTRDGLSGAIAGTVIDPFLQTVVGAQVAVSPVSQPPLPTTTTTDAAGRYKLWGLTPGVFDVSVSSGLFTTTVVRLNVVGGQTADGSVRFSAY